MTPTRRIVAILLLLAAALSSVWIWRLRDDAGPPPLVGPPRSDYELHDFDLVALDRHGRESFAASGPRLNRHPHLGTLEIEQPRFSSPDSSGAIWTSRAERAWVDREGTEMRLIGDARVQGPETPGAEPILMRSEALTLFPGERRVATDLPVTVTQPGSILTATGLRGDLDARRVELLSNVRMHESPPR